LGKSLRFVLLPHLLLHLVEVLQKKIQVLAVQQTVAVHLVGTVVAVV
jgi:hypothetical protein